MFTFGSVYAGIGGIDLGLERAGMTCSWQVEIDAYKQRVLAQHWRHVLRRADVAECGAHNLPQVDLIAGGFMCTDITGAGYGAGLDGDTRSGFTWRHLARLVREIRPRYVLVENAAELLHRGMGQVLGTFSQLGYDAEWSIVSACALGAPHTRERVFIVAYTHEEHGQEGVGRISIQQAIRRAGNQERTQSPWVESFTGVRGVANGVPARVDRLAGVGDAVVPAIGELIGRAILAREGL